MVDDDWINRAILELAETEKIVVEGAGATSLAPLLAVPNILPELQGKTYVFLYFDSKFKNRCHHNSSVIFERT